jgi:geranylgeranyl diphosphate synthase type I
VYGRGVDGMEQDFSDLIAYAKHVASMVNELILDKVMGEPKDLYDAATHLIKAGGKRLRPLATVLAGRLFGLPEEIGVRAGLSVEILHNFTLIHDDIMDKDQFRRGVPTVHTLWGEPMAIIAGDLLFAKAYEALLDLVNYGIPADNIIKAIKELTWGAITVSEGQALDMSFENKNDVTINDYIKMVYKKTAALFKSSICIGATIAGANERDLKLLTEFAEKVGIAFQIRDDELGLTADEKKLGKPIYSDLREGKRTILVIYALNNIPNDERKYLLSVLGNQNATKEELARAAQIIIRSGALKYSDELASKYLQEAIVALNAVESSDVEAKELLRKLALFVTRRQY